MAGGAAAAGLIFAVKLAVVLLVMGLTAMGA